MLFNNPAIYIDFLIIRVMKRMDLLIDRKSTLTTT
ncbi:hypothetical protein SAMN05421877_10648 [Sphingobacterium lactis]|uniref:Uncharacterized protein n=1 Tax=Sphingobacterium lactis TaxID=797291 RepID=A0A1H5YLK9_9SPHI|nr:hypothetical protein SAMN05421877_10648 [Sphingobacterium lactis]